MPNVTAFGPGTLIVTRTDIANQTPVNIGFAQSFQPDFSANIKELFGQNQFPIDVARGMVKITGKAKAALISGLAWNAVFFGQTFSAGGINWNDKEAGTVPGTPFQITVANSATFDADLGVINATTGMPLIKVASSPATGQYSVAAGVYTFAAADTGMEVKITYTNTSASATIQKLTIGNPILGTQPFFRLDYYTIRNSLPVVARFNQCTASRINFASALEDFIMPEFDISMFADSAGNVGSITFPQVN